MNFAKTPDSSQTTLTGSALMRVNRALRASSACKQVVLRAEDEPSLLDLVCHALVRRGGYLMAWVAYVEPDLEKSVRLRAYFGSKDGYLEPAQVTWADVPPGNGPMSSAIRSGGPVVARRTDTDAEMASWRAEASKRGYAASAAFPLKDSGTTFGALTGATFGALTVCAADEDAFDKDELRVLYDTAADLSYGVCALRARADQSRLQDALRRSEDRWHAAVQGSFDAFLLLRPVHASTGAVTDFVLIDLNSQTERLARLPREQLLGQRLSMALSAYFTELIPRYLPVLQTREAVEDRFALHSPEGHIIQVHHQVVPVDEGIAVIWRDVTKEMNSALLLKENEKKYRELLGSLQEGIWAADAEGRTVFVNPPMAQMLGYTAQEMLGKNIFDFVAPNLLEALNRHFVQRPRGVRESYEFEFRHKNGAPVYVHLEAGPRFDEEGKFLGTIVGVIDVTERKRADHALRASVEQLAKAEKLAALGTWSYEPATGKLAGSPEMQQILGLPPGTDEIPTATALQIFHPDERTGAREALAAMHRGEPQRNERRIVLPDGEERVILFQSEPVLDESGNVVRVDGFGQDITERKRHEAQLEHLATHDALTGLPNRRLFEDRLAQTIAHLNRRPGGFAAVLYLDLNRFKLVNDSLGHAFGDDLLRAVAHLLQGTVRSGDTVARQGGDEFILLLQDIRQPSDVLIVVDKIRSAFERPLSVQGRQLYAGCSIGASLYPLDGDDVQTLLKNADAAMYRAKQGGQAIQFYTRALGAQASERMEIENGLRHALANAEFELYYQPQVGFADGRIVGCEALIRWRHPTAGLIPPGRFIPIAEESGLIGSIGEWVLQTAYEQNGRWSANGLATVRVAVNVSASQFHRGGIQDVVSALTKRDALGARNLELEITERVVMADAEDAIERLRSLKALGITISVDDFGTGYSCLAYLKRLPIDKIKIDQSFVRDVVANESAQTLVKAIVDLSHAFGFAVVAEGVETSEQALLLAQYGCDEAQGYFFARPMPAEQFERVLREGRVALPEAVR